MSNSYKDWIDICNKKLTPIFKEFAINNVSIKGLIDIFNLLLYLPPKEITSQIFCNPTIDVVNSSKDLLLKYFNFTFGLKAKWLARKLKTNQEKIVFILLTKCFTGCDYFYHENYTNAFDSFRWCLKLLYYLEKQYKHHKYIEVNVDTLSDIELFCNVYCARCFLKDYRENEIFEWMKLKEDKKSALDDKIISESLLYGIIKSFKDFPDTSQSTISPKKYKANKVLEILTELLFFITTSECSLKEYEVEHTHKYFRLALKVNRIPLVNIIEKTIVVMNSKLFDDPSIITTTENLIKYIILHGDIQVSILYFFYSLYLYYLNRFPDYQNVPHVQLEEDCIKFAALVFQKVDEDVMIGPNGDKIIGVLPQFLITHGNGKLIMVDTLANIRNSTYNDSETEHFHVRLKLIRIWHRHGNTKNIDKKADYTSGYKWFDEWAESYIENHNNDLNSEIFEIYERVSKSR